MAERDAARVGVKAHYILATDILKDTSPLILLIICVR